MTCPLCNYAMDDFDKECPRCHGKGVAPPVAPVSSAQSTPATPPVAHGKPAPDTEATKKACTCCGLGCGLPLFLVLILVLIGSLNSGPTKDGYLPASSNIWSGVKLYYGTGENKHYAFEVVGGNENYTNPLTGQSFRGLKVRYLNGSEEWKDRNYIIGGDLYWVKADDPAIKEQRWQTYTF